MSTGLRPSRSLVKRITPQLVMVALLGTLYLLGSIGAIPNFSDLTRLAGLYLSRAPLWVVGLFSFLENLPGISAYFPGSIVILVRMTSTAGQPVIALLTYLAILVPALMANMAAFGFGRLARRWGGERGQATDQSSGRSLAMLYATTYWHPQLAALTAFASGSKGVPASQHVRLVVAIAIPWTFAWAALLYFLGEIIPLKAGDFGFLTLAYVLVWLCWDVFRHVRGTRAARRGAPI